MSKYQFNFDLIHDTKDTNLGKFVSLDTFRLAQYTLRTVLEEKFGLEVADDLFYKAGKLFGEKFYEQYIFPVENIEEFTNKAQYFLKEKGIGLLRMEETNLLEGKIVLTIGENSERSSLAYADDEPSVYEEGFLAALFSCFTQKKWQAKEIDCWCSDSKTCRFAITHIP